MTYLGARARGMSPGALAKGAARRVVRSARQALFRHGGPIEEAVLLRALGVGSAEALAPAVFGVPSRAWCDAGRRSSVLAALGAHPDARERAWERAVAALERRYRIFERTVSFGRDGAIDWQLQSTETDPKYPWQLARLEAAIALGQGYWLATTAHKRRAFSEALVALVSDFIVANPQNGGIHWACPMEVSLRAANIAQALWMMRDAPAVRAPAFLQNALRALAEHAAFVEANLEDKGLVPNNHLIADLVGLFVVSTLFPRLPGAREQRELARRGLAAQIPAQVFEDGVSFEGSTGYHRLVAELCIIATVFARSHRIALGASAMQRTHGLLCAAAAWCSKDGLAPQIGDNDSGRALALTDRRSLDHGYLAPLGAVLFADGGLKRPSERLCDEALWLFGEEGVRLYAALPARRGRTPQSFYSPRGGIHVLRGGGAVVTVSAGPQGQRGAGGHSHNDKLSFELHIGGVPVIVDPGSPVYGRDAADRNRWRASAAHNALVVDGLEQAPFDPSRLFALPEGARARVECFETGAQVDRLVAVHHGYERLQRPVTVRRELRLHKESRALVVTEWLTRARGSDDGVHEVSLGLQLPDGQVRLRGPRGKERLLLSQILRGGAVDEGLAIELGPARRPRAVLFLERGLEVSLEPSPTATGYGEIVEAVKVRVHGRVRTPWRFGWVILFGHPARRQIPPVS
ncbi:MAG: alginate lyase family protein [Myxococcaceae bacterium]|nr:alginate lyase family protein [Myxococcaceae bacterium]